MGYSWSQVTSLRPINEWAYFQKTFWTSFVDQQALQTREGQLIWIQNKSLTSQNWKRKNQKYSDYEKKTDAYSRLCDNQNRSRNTVDSKNFKLCQMLLKFI